MINGTLIEFFHWYNEDNGKLWNKAAEHRQKNFHR